jgi:hypothetical protein
MIAIPYQRHRDIVGRQMLNEVQGVLVGHVGISHPLKDMHRAMRVDAAGHDAVGATVLEQRLGVDVRLRRIFGRLVEETLAFEIATLGIGELRFHQLRCEVGRGGKEKEPGDARALTRLLKLLHHAQRNPCAHGRTHEDLRADGPLAKHGKALGDPQRDGAVGKTTGGFPVARIVVTAKGVSALPRPLVERLGLGSQHVRLEAAKPDDARRSTVALTQRDALPADIDEIRFAGCDGHSPPSFLSVAYRNLQKNAVTRIRILREARDSFQLLCYGRAPQAR